MLTWSLPTSFQTHVCGFILRKEYLADQIHTANRKAPSIWLLQNRLSCQREKFQCIESQDYKKLYKFIYKISLLFFYLENKSVSSLHSLQFWGYHMCEQGKGSHICSVKCKNILYSCHITKIPWNSCNIKLSVK